MATEMIGNKAVGSIVKLKENGVPTDYIVVHQGLPSAMYDGSCNGTWLLRKDISEINCYYVKFNSDYYLPRYLNNTFITRFESDMQGKIKTVKIPLDTGIYDAQIFLLSGYEVGLTNTDNTNLQIEGSRISYFYSGTDANANEKRIAYFNGSVKSWWLRSKKTVNDPFGQMGDGLFLINTNQFFSGVSNSFGVRPALVLPSSFYVLEDGGVTTNQPPNAPSFVTIPSTIKGGTSISVSWGTASDPDGTLAGYRLERSVNGSGWAQVYQGAGLSCSDSITYGWQTVAYRVKAYDALGMESGYTTSPTRTIINNSAPTVPTSITVPDTVQGGKVCVVSWGAAADADGNLAGYRLERSVNGGVYTQIYQGTALTYTDSITRGWTSVVYRVCAFDTEGVVSGYRDAPVRTVVNNLAPQISGADGSLGTLTNTYSQTYSVSDENGDPITVTEKLDGVILRTFAATAGTQYSMTMDTDSWQKVLNGSHSLTVTASDNQGGSNVRTWTFTKSVTTMSITLTAPLPADTMLTRCIVNVTGIITPGALYTVEVCNNGNDDLPTWEDCTQNVLNSKKHFFANKSKTAAEWGFNVRIGVDRAGAVGDCYISGINGNFD